MWPKVAFAFLIFPTLFGDFVSTNKIDFVLYPGADLSEGSLVSFLFAVQFPNTIIQNTADWSGLEILFQDFNFDNFFDSDNDKIMLFIELCMYGARSAFVMKKGITCVPSTQFVGYLDCYAAALKNVDDSKHSQFMGNLLTR